MLSQEVCVRPFPWEIEETAAVPCPTSGNVKTQESEVLDSQQTLSN